MTYFAVSIFILVSLITFPHPGIADYPDGNYAVSHVINGDTFALADGTMVRLIGIDAPDVGEYCFEQATQRLASLISNKSVYLEKDLTEWDASSNLLRYVYVGETFVNLTLVNEGYAWAVTNPPDIQYDALLTNAEQSAKNSNKGCLWIFFNPDDDTKGYLEVSCFIRSLRRDSLTDHTGLQPKGAWHFEKAARPIWPSQGLLHYPLVILGALVHRNDDLLD